MIYREEPSIRVRFRRSEAPPPVTYAVTLELEEEGVWRTVRLWDNADEIDEHHVHEYTRPEGKQKPEVLSFESINEAMSAAIAEARENAAAIVRQWRAS